MATFVFVPGSWHGAWCWERLIPLLEAAGHVVRTPDLAAMGRDPTPPADVTLALWADQIAAVVRAQAEPVILIGHSRGGVVISETAERVPDHIRALVYLSAILILDGQSLATAVAAKAHLFSDAPNAQIPDTGFVVPGPDNTTTVHPAAVQPIFFNTTPQEWVDRAMAQLGPEPMAATGTALRLTSDRFGTVPRAYIECSEDKALPLALQRSMQADLPCDPVITLDTDHSPFFSAPEALTGALLDIDRSVRSKRL